MTILRILFRGISPEKLEDYKFWWNGPPWLSQPIKEYTQNLGPFDEETASIILTEQIQPTLAVNIVIKDFEILTQFSSLSKLKRVLAYCLRFFDSTRKRKFNDKEVKKRATVQVIPDLSIEELSRSMVNILKLSQAQDL